MDADSLPFGFSEAPEILIEDGRTSDPDQWLDEAARLRGIAYSMASDTLPRWRKELAKLHQLMLKRRAEYADMRRAMIRDQERDRAVTRFDRHMKGMANLFGVTAEDVAEDAVSDSPEQRRKHEKIRGEPVHRALRIYRQTRIDWLVCLRAIRNGEKLVRECVERAPACVRRWRNAERGRLKHADDPGDGEE